MPTVTVFMPVYNGETYIKDAIQSILDQTFSDFELLIIDDGSTDNTVQIINNLNDSRIRLVENKENKGLPYTRNKGLKLAKGEYIAFMDSDDISHKERLEYQVESFNNNSEIDIVSCKMHLVDESFNLKDARYLMDKKYPMKVLKKGVESFVLRLNKYPKINIMLLFSCPIVNPGTMVKKKSIINKNINYREDYFVAQDYSFWVDCQINDLKFEILDKNLLFYRAGHTNISQISKKNKSKQRKNLINSIKERWLKDNGFHLNSDHFKMFLEMNSEGNHNINKTKDEYGKYGSVLKELIDINKRINRFNHTDFSYVLQVHWCNLILNNDTLTFRDKVNYLFSCSINKSFASFVYCFLLFMRRILR
jgi:glycosyltransferase involved in cell wall biosynthesis